MHNTFVVVVVVVVVVVTVCWWWWSCLSLFVEEEVLDGAGQVELVDVVDALLADLLAYAAATQIGERQRIGVHAVQVAHGDLAVAPHGRHDRIEALALEAAKGHAQKLALGHERHGALVHVEAHHEVVRHDERLVRLEHLRIDGRRLRRRLGVVARAIPAQVPAPRLGRAADERLIADAVQRRLLRRHADDGVRAALTRVPRQLPQVDALRVAVACAYAVGGLGDRMPVQRERIGLLDEYVERAVVGIPAVLHLGGVVAHGQVEQVLESRRYGELGRELAVVVVERDR